MKLVTKAVGSRITAACCLMAAAIITPLNELMAAVCPRTDFAEFACSPTSSLASAMEKNQYEIQWLNYKEGYDLESQAGTAKANDWISTPEGQPRFGWFSLPCTKLSSLQNMATRNFQQQSNNDEALKKVLKNVDSNVGIALNIIRHGGDFAWEWPSSAYRGWNFKGHKKTGT